jgi:hypothetical protein
MKWHFEYNGHGTVVDITLYWLRTIYISEKKVRKLIRCRPITVCSTLMLSTNVLSTPPVHA